MSLTRAFLDTNLGLEGIVRARGFLLGASGFSSFFLTSFSALFFGRGFPFLGTDDLGVFGGFSDFTLGAGVSDGFSVFGSLGVRGFFGIGGFPSVTGLSFGVLGLPGFPRAVLRGSSVAPAEIGNRGFFVGADLRKKKEISHLGIFMIAPKTQKKESAGLLTIEGQLIRRLELFVNSSNLCECSRKIMVHYFSDPRRISYPSGGNNSGEFVGTRPHPIGWMGVICHQSGLRCTSSLFFSAL